MLRAAGIAIAFQLSIAISIGCASTPKQQEQRVAASMYPARLEKENRSSGPIKRLLMRVYAEDDYRRLTLGWQVRFFKLVERASAYLHGALGIEIEIVDMKDWPNHASFASLDGALLDLESIDRAEDVDLVIGLTSPVPLATPSFHQMGMARILGRHFVLRGMDDAQEYQALVQNLGRLSGDEREELYDSRLRHKEVTVFLHELAHLFGAIHVQESESIMFDTYNDHMRYFGEPVTRATAIALAALDKDAKDKRAKDKPQIRSPETVARLTEYYEKSDYAGWNGYERERMLVALKGEPALFARATDRDISREESGSSADGASYGPKSESEKLKDASELAAGGKYEEAWLVLDPVARSHPNDKDIQAFACQLSAIREPKAEGSLARCKTAIAAGAAEPTPRLYLAYLLLQMGREDEAYAAAREAEGKIASKKDAKADLWIFLAELYQGSHALSLAEGAVKRAVSAEGADGPAAARAKPILEWVEHTRAELGLDRALPPEEEREYIAGRFDVEAALREGRFAEAERKNEALHAKYPALPGAEMLLCQAYLAHRDRARAEALCQRAAKAEPKRAKPRAILGVIAFSKGSMKAAIDHLEFALQHDPEDRDVWRTLAAVYRAAGRRDRATALEHEYRRRFGSD
jgi:predicted Zn-dependent protease